MKKYQANPNNAVYMAIISAITLVWVITLFLQMWYDKKCVRVANTNYVREVTKWPGHSKSSYIPIEYE